MIFELVRDFIDALHAMPSGHPRRRILSLLDEAIRRDVHFIDVHPTTFFQCMWNTCWWYDCPEAEKLGVPQSGDRDELRHLQTEERLFSVLEGWRAARQKTSGSGYWLRSLRPPPLPLATAQKAILRGHAGGVLSIAVSADGRRIASGGYDRTVRVWDLDMGRELCCCAGHESRVISVAFSPDGRQIVSGSWDKTLRIWSAETGEEVLVLRGHDHKIRRVAFSPDGRRVVSGADGSDKTVRVWDVETGRELFGIRGSNDHDQVSVVAYTPDGHSVISGAADGTVRLWDAETGQELQVMSGEHGVDHLSISADGQRIACGTSGQTVQVWDTLTGRSLAIILCGDHEPDTDGMQYLWPIDVVAFSPDGLLIASSGHPWYHTVHIWDAETGKELTALHGHESKVRSAVFTPDGRNIVSGSVDGTIRIWNIATSLLDTSKVETFGGVGRIKYCLGGRRIVCMSGRRARLWDTETGAELTPLVGHEGSIEDVAVARDGRRIATASYDRTVRIWDAETSLQLKVLSGHGDGVLRVIFSPDGLRVASNSLDKTFRLWDSASGDELLVFRGLEQVIANFAFSPDGRRLVCCGDQFDRVVHVLDLQMAQELLLLTGHSRSVLCAAYSADGSLITSGDRDCIVRIWDATDGQELLVLKGHKSAVYDVAISPDRSKLISIARSEETLDLDDLTTYAPETRIWNARTGQCLETIVGLGDAPSVAVDPEQFPFRALLCEGESMIQRIRDGVEIVRFPAALELSAHPSGRRWAASAHGHLYLLQLEEPTTPNEQSNS